MNVIVAFSTFVILVEIFAVRPDVHIVNRRIESGYMFHGNYRLFRRGHAADRRAVFIAAGGVTRANALYPRDSFCFAAVCKTYHVTFERPGGREHSLELNARHDVGIAPVTELAFARRIKLIESRSKQYRADIQLDGAFGHIMIDSILTAGQYALFTLRAQRTIEAPLGLGDRLFFGESCFDLIEVADSFLNRQLAGGGPRFLFNILCRRQKLFRNRFDRLLEAGSSEVMAFEITLDRFGSPFACCYSFDYGCRTGDSVTSCENTLNRCLEGDRVGLETAALGPGVYMLKKRVIIFLADGDNDLVGIDRNKVIFVIDRVEVFLFVENLRASLKLNPGSRTVAENSARTPAVPDFDTLNYSRLDLLRISGHFASLFKGYHLDVLGTETQSRACDIDGYVAPAYDDNLLSDCGFIIGRAGLP